MYALFFRKSKNTQEVKSPEVSQVRCAVGSQVFAAQVGVSRKGKNAKWGSPGVANTSMWFSLSDCVAVVLSQLDLLFSNSKVRCVHLLPVLSHVALSQYGGRSR